MAISPITRSISGKGLIKIPDEYRKARQILLYVDLLRPSSNEYLNVTWNPSRRFYAHVTFCIGQHVLYGFDVNYERQVFEVFSSQSSQNLLAQICALENILDSFVQYATASGLSYVKNNGIKTFGFNTFLPDTIRFACYADCALQLELKAVEFDKCSEDQGAATPPPPPPPPPAQVPPKTPVLVSPPYEGEDDNGDTVPNPLDEPETPPIGEECERILITINYRVGAAGSLQTAQEIVFGPVERIEYRRTSNSPDVFTFYIECRGIERIEINCQDNFRFYEGAFVQSGADLTYTIEDITPIPQ